MQPSCDICGLLRSGYCHLQRAAVLHTLEYISLSFAVATIVSSGVSTLNQCQGHSHSALQRDEITDLNHPRLPSDYLMYRTCRTNLYLKYLCRALRTRLHIEAAIRCVQRPKHGHRMYHSQHDGGWVKVTGMAVVKRGRDGMGIAAPDLACAIMNGPHLP